MFLVFGRVGEEIELLAQEGVAFQVVPDNYRCQCYSSYTGIPLAHRDYVQSCVLPVT